MPNSFQIPTDVKAGLSSQKVVQPSEEGISKAPSLQSKPLRQNPASTSPVQSGGHDETSSNRNSVVRNDDLAAYGRMKCDDHIVFSRIIPTPTSTSRSKEHITNLDPTVRVAFLVTIARIAHK